MPIHQSEQIEGIDINAHEFYILSTCVMEHENQLRHRRIVEIHLACTGCCAVGGRGWLVGFESKYIRVSSCRREKSAMFENMH